MKTVNIKQSELDEHEKTKAEIAKLIADTSKINKNQLYVAIGASITTLVIVAVVKFFL